MHMDARAGRSLPAAPEETLSQGGNSFSGSHGRADGPCAQRLSGPEAACVGSYEKMGGNAA